jgi:hypothetical protein
MILFCLIKVKKLIVLKGQNHFQTSKRVILTPIKRKMDLNSKSIGLVLSVEVQRYSSCRCN